MHNHGLGKNFIHSLINFFKEVYKDKRIPERDKKIIIFLFALVISPLDFIPDWIFIFGLLDDLLILGLICHYLFVILDSQILISHYPWSLKAYRSLAKIGIMLSKFRPPFVSNFLWKYQRDVF
jgi:uncharacterized membrane protein YkvA (DUF1232 family)